MIEISATLSFFDYTFKNKELLKNVFLHPSLGFMRSRKNATKDYAFDRLEFLGDRVLGLVIAEILYEKYPDVDEGELSLRSSSLVRMESLYQVAVQSGLKDHIRHELPPHETTGKNLLADAMEAFLAALYLDGGLATVKRFINQYWEAFLEDRTPIIKPAKTSLQEWAHQQKLPSPVYTVVAEDGPKHLPIFDVKVTIPSTSYQAEAQGSSIKQAENLAAYTLMNMLKK